MLTIVENLDAARAVADGQLQQHGSNILIVAGSPRGADDMPTWACRHAARTEAVLKIPLTVGRRRFTARTSAPKPNGG